MSRIGKLPITVPAGVTVTVDENTRFYIPEEMLFRAEKQYKEEEHGLLSIVLGTVAIIIAGVIITYLSLN